MKGDKHYNICDHLGTLQQTYKNNGISTVPTSMSSKMPFGNSKWSNTNLSNTYDDLENWVGKEKDNESKLGDHGVRKYEYETGRFISIDPLWANYYDWTPYQYSGNDPINKSDPNGRAWWTDHIMMDIRAQEIITGSVNLDQKLSFTHNQMMIELFEGVGAFYNEESHLDNMSNSDLRPILESGSYKNLTTHQTQDFYYHSNYIELMVQRNYSLGSIPVFNQLIPGSELYNYILKNIMTGNYPAKSDSDIHSHDRIKDVNDKPENFGKTGEFSAKDSENHPYYQAAFRLGVMATAYIFLYREEIARINQRQRDNDRSGKESPHAE